MKLARVLGRVVATRKDEGLAGKKLLLLQPIDSGGADRGRALIAVDAAGAGAGEVVFYVRGREASIPFLPAEVPADACVAGIVDPSSMPATARRRP